MKIFAPLYDMTLSWAKHRHAPRYLGGLSFAESMFFPIPPDVMLAPMALAKPENAWHFALITTIGSVLGGIAGYLMGMLAFESVLHPWIIDMGYQSKLDDSMSWFEAYGIWVVLIAGFSPIPYKIFTISAGVLGMAFLPFIAASAIGRGARFYLVAGLMRWGGAKMEATLRTYVEWLGWAVIVLAVSLYFYLR